MVKHLPAMQETWVQSLGQEDLLEKEMAIHSNCHLEWEIPWTEEPGKFRGQRSLGNSVDRGAWQAPVYSVAKSQTRLSI